MKQLESQKLKVKLVLYLKPAPVRDHDHIDILEAGEDGDDQPGDEEAVVAEVGSKDEQQAAPNTKERVKHRVLDDRANTNVLKIIHTSYFHRLSKSFHCMLELSLS